MSREHIEHLSEGIIMGLKFLDQSYAPEYASYCDSNPIIALLCSPVSTAWCIW